VSGKVIFGFLTVFYGFCAMNTGASSYLIYSGQLSRGLPGLPGCNSLSFGYRQKKVNKEKATRSLGRFAVP
jgi:hypothetical protein